MKISVVIPLFNEADLVEELINRTVTSLGMIPADHEIIIVDDGSTDETLHKLLEQRQKNPHIKVIRLSRNFGHQAAYTAGLSNAKGDYTVLLDGDLQDPPELIPDLYKKAIENQLDVVYGKRINSRQLSRRPILSGMFHKMFKKLSGFPDIENVGNFSLMSRRAVSALLSYQETNRYLPGLRRLVGFSQGYIEYERSERFSGKSKMSLAKLFSLSADAIFSFSKVPIRICLYLGIAGIIVFFAAGLYTLIAKIAGFALPGWSSTLLSIYFLGSIQLTFLGVLGEYIYRIYKESQKRPLYFIEEYYQ